jgi:hypothetical protein
MSEGAIRTLTDRRQNNLAEIARLRGARITAVKAVEDIDKAMARCERVVTEMEEGIVALGGTFE